MVTVPAGAHPRLHIVTASGTHDDDARNERHLVALVAHAGLGISRPCGAPNRTTLRRTTRSAAEAVELDICTTADRALVLQHDLHTARGIPLSTLTFRDVRRRSTCPLTLDEGVDELDPGTRLVLDLKTVDAVEPLARWLLRRPDASRFVVCTERVDALRQLTLHVPSAEIWQTFPHVGRRAHERLARVIAGMFAQHARRAVSIAGDVAGIVGRIGMQPNDTLARLAGVPWSRLLPRLMSAVREDLGACGVSVHHALVTSELCAAARAEGLTVTAWTVNEPDVARRVAACGVDMITSDHVAAIRRVVPTRPQVLAGGVNLVAG